jgi:hypothetical protein
MSGLMEGHRFIRQAMASIPNYYDLTSVPPLELGKIYQVITKSGALYYKMRVLRISPMGEVLVEKSGGAYAERHAACATCPYPVRDFFNFDMLLWEEVKIRPATASASSTRPNTTPRPSTTLSPTESLRRQLSEQKAQKRTVADIQNTGTAMYSWLVEQTGERGSAQPQAQEDRTTVDLEQYSLISRKDLEKILVPRYYIGEIPETDGWGHAYEFYLNVAPPLAPQMMGMRSPGRDGKFSGSAYRAVPFAPNNFDEDIIWVDNKFVRWPQVQ